ncbi:MAG: hypothetical protein ACO1SV_17765 [Fimbriimonas sp.]
MKLNPTSRSLFVAVLAVAFSVGVIGCDSGPGGKPQSIASDEKVNQIVEMRAIYDKVKGNWNSLSADDKAKYTQMAGDDAKAKAMWEGMSRPAGATPPQ